MPHLDALRAFAVIAVLIHHFSPNDFSEKFQLGHSGVQLFFVLSGFLITGILLKDRERSSSTRRSGGAVLGSFYCRRFLRIFPAYYIALVIAWIAGNSEVRQDLLWHATYSSNFLIADRGDWGLSTSHFWTLAVEQQFYLFWPLCILFIRKSFILPLIVAMIFCGPLFRLSGYEWLGLPDIAIFTLPFSSWDSLGMGAFLAWVQHKPRLRETVMKVGFWMFVFSAVWMGLELKQYFLQADVVWMEGVRAAGFCWLVGRAAQGMGRFTGRWFKTRPLVYLGKISYGVYVYHLFTPLMLRAVFDFWGWSYPDNPALAFSLCFLTTLAFAVLSWHWMEKPILSLKSRINALDLRSLRKPDSSGAVASVPQTGPVFSMAAAPFKFKTTHTEPG